MYFYLFCSNAINEVKAMSDSNIGPKTPKNQAEIIPEDIYPVIDNDLARDNLENDIPAADLQDLDG